MGDRREWSVCSILLQSDAHWTKVWGYVPISIGGLRDWSSVYVLYVSIFKY